MSDDFTADQKREFARSGNPFLRCGCGATWPCAQHDAHTATRSVIAMQRARELWWRSLCASQSRAAAFGPPPLAEQAFAAGYAAALASLKMEDVNLPPPYAYEFGRSNGDGTYTVVIERGSMVKLGPNRWGYGPPRDPHPDHPVKPLYEQPLVNPGDCGCWA